MSARRRPQHPSQGARLAVCGIGAHGVWDGRARKCADLHTVGSSACHGRYHQLLPVLGIPVRVPRRIGLNPAAAHFHGRCAEYDSALLYETRSIRAPHGVHCQRMIRQSRSWCQIPTSSVRNAGGRAASECAWYPSIAQCPLTLNAAPNLPVTPGGPTPAVPPTSRQSAIFHPTDPTPCRRPCRCWWRKR